VTLSVVIISHNEEANIGRTLQSVKQLVRDGKGEIIVVDSRSTDRTVQIAESHGAKVFIEEWKGYAAQKNSAIEKALGDWILSLDADEELDKDLQQALAATLNGLERIVLLTGKSDGSCAQSMTIEDARADLDYHAGIPTKDGFAGLRISRKNHFLGRWIRHGGFWPDPKLRFFRHGTGRFEDRAVHESLQVEGPIGQIRYGAIIHHSYPTFSDYIAHMNRYSSLGAEMAVAKGKQNFLVLDIVFRPLLTFTYNYFFRLGFLDGREGFLLHVGHAIYVSWKYMKIWELQQ
jgi:glycosyltransferase involved in cell wall biosynthesis